MLLKNFRKAIHVFSIGNLLFILLSPYLEQVSEKCGFLSIPHIIISVAIWFLCVIATMFALLLEEKEEND